MPVTYKRHNGIITKRTGPIEGDPLTITYDAMVVDGPMKGKLKVTNHLPKRRVSKGAMVISADPGDPCEFVVVGDKVFLYVHEGIPFQEACT
jgi:hypothetical protein